MSSEMIKLGEASKMGSHCDKGSVWGPQSRWLMETVTKSVCNISRNSPPKCSKQVDP